MDIQPVQVYVVRQSTDGTLRARADLNQILSVDSASRCELDALDLVVIGS